MSSSNTNTGNSKAKSKMGKSNTGNPGRSENKEQVTMTELPNESGSQLMTVVDETTSPEKGLPEAARQDEYMLRLIRLGYNHRYRPRDEHEDVTLLGVLRSFLQKLKLHCPIQRHVLAQIIEHLESFLRYGIYVDKERKIEAGVPEQYNNHFSMVAPLFITQAFEDAKFRRSPNRNDTKCYFGCLIFYGVYDLSSHFDPERNTHNLFVKSLVPNRFNAVVESVSRKCNAFCQTFGFQQPTIKVSEGEGKYSMRVLFPDLLYDYRQALQFLLSSGLLENEDGMPYLAYFCNFVLKRRPVEREE